MTDDPIAIFQKHHERRIAALGVGFVIVIAAVLAGIFIVQQKADAVRAVRAGREGLIADLRALANLKNEKEQVDAILPRLTAALPLDIDVPTKVIPGIKKLGVARNLSVEADISPEAPEHLGTFSSVGFSVKADGDLANLVGFVHDIETADTILGIKDWNIGPSGSKGYQLSLRGLIYIRDK